LQATAGSVEMLRNMIGDYLFEAMEASDCRKEGKRQGVFFSTDAFKISSHDSNGGGVVTMLTRFA
jgi:hypothetical protein